MSTPGQVAGATQQAAGQTASTAKDEAVHVGSTAASAASEVAGTTKEQAGAVASEAVSQVRGLLDQTKSQVSDQAVSAQSKLGDSVRSLAEELRSMGDGSGSGSGPAAEVVRSLADRGQALADTLSNKQPGELVEDLRAFASRRPGGFLLGALVAGVAAGRLVRGAKDSASSSSSGAPSTYPADVAYQPAATGVYDAPLEPAVGSYGATTYTEVYETEPAVYPTATPTTSTFEDPVVPVGLTEPTDRPGGSTYGTGTRP